ncbi:protein kinase domain-containing protein [Legionella tunisiensis]|uniref:protein kinase domain-containing protein n=1 Tax=Legionella tunisiensis TaxID=1034944 RepID=UPI00036B14BD|nr:protein kinase [Legionella tunisiensis]
MAPNSNFPMMWLSTKRKDKSQVRYDFITDKCIGKGKFGSIFEIAGTLKLTEGKIHYKQAGHNDKTRVVKIQCHNNSQELSETEYNLSKEAAHMAVKEPTIDGSTSYSVMRKLKGRELADILKDDQSHKKPLTVQQRLDLTQALLKALKEQVSDCGIIHRDIKQQNILVDLNESITVNIIDYGSSAKNNDNDHKLVGSPIFMAPEIWSKSDHTEKVDVFSMARVLAFLWHLDEKTFGTKMHELPSIANQQPNLSSLFTGIDGINPENQQIIKTMLNGMLQPKVDDRFSIEQAIAIGEEFTLNLQIDFSAIKNSSELYEHRESLLNILDAKEKQGYSIEAVKQDIEQRFAEQLHKIEEQLQRDKEECKPLKISSRIIKNIWKINLLRKGSYQKMY